MLRKIYFWIYEPKQKYNWYKLDLKLVNTFISKISYILNNLFQLYFWTQLFFLSRSWFMDKIITVLGYKKFITEMSYAPDCISFWKIPSLWREIANFHEYEVRGGDSRPLRLHCHSFVCLPFHS